MLAPYPLAEEAVRQKKDRSLMLVEKTIPKSQLLQRARQEHETAETLGRVFDEMIKKAGFWTDGNEIMPPALSTDDPKTTRILKDAKVGRIVNASELYQAYLADKVKHPMCCDEAAIDLVKALMTARRELYRQYNGLQAGQDGEDNVAAYLKNVAESSDYILHDNMMLNKQVSGHVADTSEIDICVITPQGIVLCEVKNKYQKGNKKIRISRAGRWEEHDLDTGRSYVPDSSPLDQNNTHDRDLRKLLRNHGYGFVPTMPVIVIANKNVEVDNESLSDVIYTSALDEFFRHCERNPPCLTREQMEDIARLLQEESAQVTERAFTLKVLSQSADAMKEQLERYISDYKQERFWHLENSQIVYEFTKSVQERVEAERQRAKALEEAERQRIRAQEEAERQRIRAREEAERQRIRAQEEAERQRLADQQETARKLAQEKRERRKRRFLRTICIAAALMVFLAVLPPVVNALSETEAMKLLPYKLCSGEVFCNYFGDTVVLTNWPIDEYNGQKCTAEWSGSEVKLTLSGYEIVRDICIHNFEDHKTVVVLEDIYPVNLAETFADMESLQRIEGIEKIHTDHVVSMASMFAGCTDLQSIEGLSSFDVSNVTNMEAMFEFCNNLENIDALSGWDVSNVQDLGYIFSDCGKLQNIDALSGWDVSSVQDMSGVFAHCEKLENVDAIANWDTSSAYDIGDMFVDCYSLKNIDGLSDWDVSNVKHMGYTFGYCTELENTDALANWDTSCAQSMSCMFEGCDNLQNIDGLSGWDVSNVKHMDDMFMGCNQLTDLPSWYHE